MFPGTGRTTPANRLVSRTLGFLPCALHPAFDKGRVLFTSSDESEIIVSSERDVEMYLNLEITKSKPK